MHGTFPLVDPFDPTTWEPDTHEYRIYGDDKAQTWCVVDYEDYIHFSRWCWHPNHPPKHRAINRRYFTRSTSNGRRYGVKLFLHVEIMKRTGVKPPSPAHNVVNHKNGNPFDCRRGNLEWATVFENSVTKSRIKRRPNGQWLSHEHAEPGTDVCAG